MSVLPMMRTRHFVVICRENEPVFLRDALTRYLGLLQTSGVVSWWHNYAFVWFVTDANGATASQWRDSIMATCPGMGFFIVETKTAWSGYENPETFAWFQATLGEPD